jgi:hypothetical protein
VQPTDREVAEVPRQTWLAEPKSLGQFASGTDAATEYLLLDLV